MQLGNIGLGASIAAAVLTACIATPALADEPAQGSSPVLTDEMRDAFDRGCGDDRGQDRCDGENQAKMLELYGWQSAEAMVRQGIEFRRFMMVDGYGRDVLGLSFERRPGESPSVNVAVPRVEQEGLPIELPPETPLTARLGEQHWQRVISLTSNFDDMLASEDAEDGAFSICLHSWFTVMEAGSARTPYAGDERQTFIRRDAEGACARGLAMPASFALAELAYETLPECDGLTRDDFRNVVMLLARCKSLGGDRIAARRASEFVDRLQEELEKDEPTLATFFGFNNRAAGETFLKRMGGNYPYWGAPYAENQLSATVIGSLIEEDADDDADEYRIAFVTLHLRASGVRWRIESYEVSDFQTVEY